MTSPGTPSGATAPSNNVGTSLLADNDQVRVWELRLEPGETSELHRHRHDYVMVQIEGDRIAARFEPESEGSFAGHEVLEGEVSPGLAIYAEKGGIETAVNTGDETFREIVVEVKSERRPGLLAVQHVALTVTDLEAAMAFYTEILGFDILPRPDFGVPGVWMATGNGVQIHLVEDAAFEPPSGPHLAFETADIHAEVARLRDLGVEVGDPFELFGVHQAFFHDPAGNQFELNQPAPG